MKLILASQSPRRQELLKFITEQFEVIPADIDENVYLDIQIEKIPEYLAVKKAEFIFKSNTDSVVIGCDTGVFLQEQMLGKPKNKEDALRMINLLNGKTHTVITGCCIYSKDKFVSFTEKTEVTFRRLSENEIQEYISTEEPYDKAGAYGIQGKGALLVEGINGDYFNVMGLPVSRLNVYLKDFM